MSLIRQTSLTPITRLVLAVALVCALLVTQWRLNDHVVEHSANTLTVSSNALSNDSGSHDGPGCLVCLEHQAHGAALTSAIVLAVALTVAVLIAKALPPNTPYLAPERARQRAPPVLS